MLLPVQGGEILRLLRPPDGLYVRNSYTKSTTFVQVNTDHTPHAVRNAFRVFAGSAPDGSIHVDDLERALQLYGRVKLTAEEAKNMIAQIETLDGFFKYDEHITMMMPDGCVSQTALQCNGEVCKFALCTFLSMLVVLDWKFTMST